MFASIDEAWNTEHFFPLNENRNYKKNTYEHFDNNIDLSDIYADNTFNQNQHKYDEKIERAITCSDFLEHIKKCNKCKNKLKKNNRSLSNNTKEIMTIIVICVSIIIIMDIFTKLVKYAYLRKQL